MSWNKDGTRAALCRVADGNFHLSSTFSAKFHCRDKDVMSKSEQAVTDSTMHLPLVTNTGC